MSAAAAETWRAAREWADEGLPGVPASERGVRKAADREGWPFRDRTGRGGGREYPLSALPLVARLEWAKRNLVVDDVRPAPAERDAGETSSDTASTPAVQRDARLALVQAARGFRRTASGRTLSIVVADSLFAALYNAGAAQTPEWVRAAVKRVSPRSLARWRTAAKEDAGRLAVDKAAARKGKGLLDLAEGGEVRTHILALIIHQPHLSASHVRKLVGARFGDTLDVVDAAAGEAKPHPLPPLRTFQHFLAALKASHKVELVAVGDPDAFRSRYRVRGRGSLKHVTRPGQLWMIDASPADVLTTEGRQSVYVAIDVATRRMLVYVSRTPRASAVAMLMRRAILAWGVPVAVKTDNGSDFVAVATQRLFAALDIEAIACVAFQPQEKGHVERAIGTLQRDLGPLLPGFIGHSVADRKSIEARKAFAARLGESDERAFCVALDGPALQAACDAWVDNSYQHRPHEGLKGRTPFAVAAAAADAIRTVEERALDLLIAPIAGRDGLRTVTASGIRIDHQHYLVGDVMPGTTVLVRMDPADLGRCYLFTPDGDQYLGEAICPSIAGIDPATAVRVSRAAQRAHIDDRLRDARREAKRIGQGPSLADLVDAEARRNAPNLVSFPRREVAHETPQIAAALAAATPPPAPQHSAETLEMHRRLAAEVATPAPAVVPIRKGETQHQRYARALAIERAIAAQAPVDTDDAVWLGGYKAGSEYRAMRQIVEDFGESVLA